MISLAYIFIFINYIQKLLLIYNHNFYRAMLCISTVYAGMWCLSVCLSVTFVSCAKMNKDIFEFFSPSGSQAIQVFHTKRGGADGNPPNGGVECKGL